MILDPSRLLKVHQLSGFEVPSEPGTSAVLKDNMGGMGRETECLFRFERERKTQTERHLETLFKRKRLVSHIISAVLLLTHSSFFIKGGWRQHWWRLHYGSQISSALSAHSAPGSEEWRPRTARTLSRHDLDRAVGPRYPKWPPSVRCAAGCPQKVSPDYHYHWRTPPQ